MNHIIASIAIKFYISFDMFPYKAGRKKAASLFERRLRIGSAGPRYVMP